jgi:hypothetical protein
MVFRQNRLATLTDIKALPKVTSRYDDFPQVRLAQVAILFLGTETPSRTHTASTAGKVLPGADRRPPGMAGAEPPMDGFTGVSEPGRTFPAERISVQRAEPQSFEARPQQTDSSRCTKPMI